MSSTLYIIAWSPQGPVKFGIADDPTDRLSGHQVSCPYRLRLYAAWLLDTRELALAAEASCLDDVKLFALQGEWAKVSVKQALWVVRGALARMKTAEVRWRPSAEQRVLRERQLTKDRTKGEARRRQIAVNEFAYLQDKSRH